MYTDDISLCVPPTGHTSGEEGGSIPLPEPFCMSDVPVLILGVWFGPSLQFEQNWLEVRAKVKAQVGSCP